MSDSHRNILIVLGFCIYAFLVPQVRAQDADVVVDLQLSPRENMIDAFWDLQNPSGNVSRYAVTYTKAAVGDQTCYADYNSTQGLECVTLVSCSWYTVTVQPRAIIGLSEENTGTPASNSTYTLPDESAQISDVVCSTSDLDITVTWMGPGECVEYIVSYNGTVLWGEKGEQYDSVRTNQFTATFDDLVPYTDYIFTVGADDDYGEGSCARTTPEKAPTAPTNVIVTNVSTTSALVEWRAPDEANGVLGTYTVRWAWDEGQKDEAATNETNFEIVDLSPCTKYSVSVAASTGAGEGEESNLVFFNTSVQAPPPVTSLEAESVTSRSITITWTRPNTSCDINKYIIVYGGAVMWGEEATIDNTTLPLNVTNDNDTMEEEIGDLTPYSNYSITVRASTQGEEGEASQPLYSQTGEEVPSAPTNLQAIPLNSSSVQVAWETPSEENGKITSYTVRWELTSDKPTENNTLFVPGDESSCDVLGLLACTTYKFSVTASTSVGEGQGDSTEGRTVSEAPDAPIVSCQEKESSIEVTWISPNSTCEIEEFDIETTIDVIWTEDEYFQPPGTVDGSETQYQIPQPIPYSIYTTKVRANATDGVAGEYGLCSVQTDQKAPSEPQHLAQVDATTDSLTIAWDQPERLNGKMLSYFITWQVFDANATSASIEAQEYQTTYNYTITGLTASTEYNVTVQGVTVAEGPPANDVFTTAPAASTSSSVAGIVIGCIFGIILLVLIVVAFIKRDLLKQKYNGARHRHSNSPDPRREFGISDYRGSVLRGIQNNIYEFEANPATLTRAYEELKAASPSGISSVAQSRTNMSKNRYYNILPFDETRVKLQSDWGVSDYINASYVKDAHGVVRFIACQGPKEETMDDFWNMLWQEDVNIVVMLANCYEGEKEKCSMYWPADCNTSTVHGEKYLTLENENAEGDYVKRIISLEFDSRREITQFHLTNWPDFGVPASERVLLDLVKLVREAATDGNKVVVHCSAGVGRTGTFIALWNLQQKMERKESINIDATILQMRKDRKDMIQTKEQYLYVFKCLAEYISPGGSNNDPGIQNPGFQSSESTNQTSGYLDEDTARNRASAASWSSSEHRTSQVFTPTTSTASIYDDDAASSPYRAPPPSSSSPAMNSAASTRNYSYVDSQTQPPSTLQSFPPTPTTQNYPDYDSWSMHPNRSKPLPPLPATQTASDYDSPRQSPQRNQQLPSLTQSNSSYDASSHFRQKPLPRPPIASFPINSSSGVQSSEDSRPPLPARPKPRRAPPPPPR